MTALATVEQLNEEGRFGEALNALDRFAPSREERNASDVLRAELLERVGRYSLAKSLCERLRNTRDMAPVHHSSLEHTLALIERHGGDNDKAITHLQRSIAMAEIAKDHQRLCWSQLRLMVILADRFGHAAAATLLERVRFNIVRIGNPVLSAALHIVMGEMEGRRGLIESATRHTEIGKRLLGDRNHVWLDGFVENNRTAICIMRSEIDEGIYHAERALRLAEASGGVVLQQTALANLGNLFYQTGQFESAIEYFERAQAIFPTVGERKNASLESLARVRLAQGDRERAAEHLTEILQSITDAAESLMYSNRHSRLTMAMLLVSQDRLKEAEQHAEIVIRLAATSGDQLLQASAQITQAEILQRMGRVSDATVIFENVLPSLSELPPQVYAQYQRAWACGFAVVGAAESGRRHFERAKRIYEGLHSVPGVLEVTRAWEDAVAAAPERLTTALTSAENRTPSANNLLQNIAALMLHAGRPELVATGLVAILADTSSVVSAQAISRGNDDSVEILAACAAADSDSNADVVERTLQIGSARNRAVDVVLKAHSDIESIATLNAVTLLLGTIRDLERAHVEREERLTLWPLEEIPRDGEQTVIMGRMSELMSFARRVAPTNVSVLITGESGTGKEILARAIHGYSARAEKPFVPFNCTAIPRDLLESQLFGYRRGAFTGADRDSQGLIRTAREGTLFLDEIGELGLDLQPKLLRFLESGEICPLGEPSPFIVDVRIIAATNSNLEQLVQDGRFREDLFYRLNVIRLTIPPLRERRDEIPALVHHFVARAAQEFGKGRVRVAEETMEHLLLYSWPGNVRQVNNELRRMVALAETDEVLRPATLSKEILRALPKATRGNGGMEIAVPLADKLTPTLSRIEREMIKAALKTNQGRVEDAAKSLGISRKGLYLKRQRLGL
jgi:DNA-binding NtrC family response regulator/tetratricopeptide (TPR) repeat protein